MKTMTLGKARRGRPLKFSRPARTVTLTLPEDVIQVLTRADADLGRAVVRLAMTSTDEGSAAAEVTQFGSRGVIVVPPTRALSALPGVELIPLADGRALISLDTTLTAAGLELQLRDQLDGADLDSASRKVFDAVCQILQGSRREGQITTRQILVLRSTGGSAD